MIGSIKELRVRYENKEYQSTVPYPSDLSLPTGFVFDENLDADENSALVDHHNEDLGQKLRKYYEARMNAEESFKNDASEALVNEFGLSCEAAKKLVTQVYSDFNPASFNFFPILRNYARLIDEILKLQEKEKE